MIKLTPEAYYPVWRERIRRLLCSLRDPATDHIRVCAELVDLQYQYNICWIPAVLYKIADRYSEYPHPSTHQYYHPDFLAKEKKGYEEFVSRSRVEAQQAAEKVLAEQFPDDSCE